MSLDVGSILPAKVEYGMAGGSFLPPERGRVVYIHPDRYFIVVEFTFPCGAFRESYALRGRIGSDPAWGEEPDISTWQKPSQYAPHLVERRKRR